jgi:hypothetical protein
MRGLRFGLLILIVAANLLASDIPRGAKITVRTSTMVGSDRSLFGDPVDAVLVNDLVVNGKVIAPQGSLAHGIVSSATPSRSGKLPLPGSVSIRLETIETSQETYHLSTNQYTRQGKGSSRPPVATGAGGGISIDSVGGVQTQKPSLGTDTSDVTLGGGGPEAIIPAQSVITFKTAAISTPDRKN